MHLFRFIVFVTFFYLCNTLHAQPLVQITTTVDFGKDRGQNFGTLFEARNTKGDLIAGAGFVGVYNTRFRSNRHTLQFFVRPQKVTVNVEALPRSVTDSGCYMFDYNGRLYTASHYKDRMVRWWDESSKKWIDDPHFGSEVFRKGDMLMRVAGKELRAIDSQMEYDGKVILPRPSEGYYHHFYYALGHLVFFHNNRHGDPAFSRLYACKWDPQTNQPLNLENTAFLDVTFPGEEPQSIGQLNGKIVYPSNRGGVYTFDGQTWQVLRSPKQKGSYQLYSMLNWYDKLLMAHYPSGHQFEYDGKSIRELNGWPPRIPGVSGASREAQTTCIYGGDIYVGVWPWAELWRRDKNTEAWSFVQRMFTQPAVTDAVDHPWEQELRDYNKAHGTKIIFNNWGQRITGLVALGSSLYISTASKGSWPQGLAGDSLATPPKPPLAFLTDEVRQEYGRVYRLTMPGVVSVPIQWKNGPTTLQFTITPHQITITQDGKPLATTDVQPTSLKNWKITWAKGVFGPLGGNMTHPRLQVIP